MFQFEEKQIDEVAFVIGGGTPSSSNPSFWNGDINWITPAELSSLSDLKFQTSKRRISRAGLNSSNAKLVPAGSVVISTRAPIGYVAIGTEEFSCNQGCKILIPKEGIHSEYLSYVLQQHIEKVKRYGEGTTFSEISKANLSSKIKLPFPNHETQTRIAHILSTADDQIQATKTMIAKHKMIKEGMLQDLFTRGIDVKTGNLRPSYNEAPELYKESEIGMIPKEWSILKFMDCVTCLDGQRVPIKSEDRARMQGDIPYYGASGIIDYVNDFLFEDSLILLGEDGENVVSRNSPLAFQIHGKTWVNNHAHVFKPKEGFSLDYLTYAFEKLDYQDIVLGSAQPKISQSGLKKKFIATPKLYEQHEISATLGILEGKLDYLQAECEKTTQLKSGLMTDLLSKSLKAKLSSENVIKI